MVGLLRHDDGDAAAPAPVLADFVALDIGEATAKTHVARILQKLGVRDRVQSVIYAYENGIA